MKKLLLVCFLVPFIGLSQTKTVVHSTRAFPKVDKVAEFEKGITAHAQKYHVGDWKWRIYKIQSGPDAGGFHIIEGPHSWDQIDRRGNLGAEHTADWNKSVAPFLTEKNSSLYATYREDLSTIQLTDYTDKIAITHYFPKPGSSNKMIEALKLLKKVFEAGNQTVAVYEASASGPLQFSLVYRYKQGLKEREAGFMKPMKERYESAHGAGSFDPYLEMIRTYVDNAWSELLFYRADLSSK